MQMRRVVVTGIGAVSPFGCGFERLTEGLLTGRSAVTYCSALESVGGLRSQIAALVPTLDAKAIPRKFRRSMSAMSIYATLAGQEALTHARLDAAACQDGRTGVVIGSTVGSTLTTEEFFIDYLADHSLERMKSTLFFHIMNHSCASNVAQALDIRGRLLAPSAACSTGCQAIGYGFEMIAFGKQDRMLCGGADEFHPLTVATFDVMHAASINFNATPTRTPRPFDRDRDGVVCAAGSGILLLEELELAKARGANILAEIVGFATLTDSSNIANPNPAAMTECMRLALADAGLEAAAVDYVNAHATATEQGDIAEAQAIHELFGARVPVSSFKGHMGHAMAASGSLELAGAVGAMQRGLIAPTLNLEHIDPACAQLDHVRQPRETQVNLMVKNNFALGGVNSSIVLRRYPA
ncbi:MAG: beta-ketoacyl-[acyl-carrier-protein] synthase family protein [Desulfuromonadaceae bacterium]|nr:beta-ketoacyl-[acyl-carrier-protein] synthase family protein [Desulfuromonadaceae bacterium]